MSVIDIKGIVRSTSAQNNADGNCEEMINLRQKFGAWRVVGRKKSIIEDVEYENVFLHKYRDFENYIGLLDGKVIWFASIEDGKVVRKNVEVCSVEGDVSFSNLNNVLFVRSGSMLISAIFKNGRYDVKERRLPDVPKLRFNATKEVKSSQAYVKLEYNLEDKNEYTAAQEQIAGMFNQEKGGSEYFEGRVFVCVNYTLFDGSETKMSAPYCVDFGQEYVKGIIRSKSTGAVNNGKLNCEAKVVGLPVYTLRIRVVGIPGAEYKDIINRINIYVSRPFSFYDLGNINPAYIYPESGSDPTNAIPEKKLSNVEVGKMLLYRIASFDLSDTSMVIEKVDFNAITTNPTLPVDTSGWIDYAGRMFVYNNRLHLFDRVCSFVDSENLGQCYSLAENEFFEHISGGNGFTRRRMVAVVYLRAGDEEVVMRYEFDGANTTGKYVKFPKVVAYQDSRAYKIVFYDKNNSCRPFEVLLTESDSYNMAFGIIDDVEVNMNWSTGTASIPEEQKEYHDNMNIVVSAPSNPYYFPPEHSYAMPGEIINLSVNTEQISASQIGMFPLYAFTTEGIYALQVGDGNVLYGNIIPVSAEMAVKGSNVLQTKYGILFVTESGLKIIAGQEVLDISDQLKGSPDLSIRESKQYMRAITHKYTLNIEDEISQVDFLEYIRGCVMGYDIANDEIIVSNYSYHYSYVYELENKMWHKLTDVFYEFQRSVCVRGYIGIEPATSAVIVFALSGTPVSGDRIGIKIGDDVFEYVVQLGDSINTVIRNLVLAIQRKYEATMLLGGMIRVHLYPGADGNSTPINVFGGLNIEYNLTKEGTDEHERLIRDVCDVRFENDIVQPVWIQTRPIRIDSFDFKRISHCVVRGEFKPLDEEEKKYYGCYVFASNDLKSWRCVSEKIFSKELTHAVLSRVAKSFVYFVILSGGYVKPGHCVIVFEVEGDVMYNNRLR